MYFKFKERFIMLNNMLNNELIKQSHQDKCISWRPILAGALAAIGFSFLLNLFSVALGLTAFTVNSQGVETLALGGLLGTSIGIIVSMFGAGWLAGYLGQHRGNKHQLGAIYGFLAWCVALIISIFLASHIQQYISFYSHFISHSANIIFVNDAGSSTGLAVIGDHVPAKSLTTGTYIVFFLFFLAALASSAGGHYGMRHTWKDDDSLLNR
jgi:hypothetical protein